MKYLQSWEISDKQRNEKQMARHLIRGRSRKGNQGR